MCDCYSFAAGLDTRAQGDYMHNLKVLCGEDPLDDLVALPPVLPQRTMACAQAMLGIAVRNGATSVQVAETGFVCLFCSFVLFCCLPSCSPWGGQVRQHPSAGGPDTFRADR